MGAGVRLDRRMRSLLVALVGLALLVAAGVVVATTPGMGGDFGWFAYTPLSEQVDDGQLLASIDGDPVLIVLSRGRAVAVAVLAGLGLVLLAGTAGFRAGLRRARPDA